MEKFSKICECGTKFDTCYSSKKFCSPRCRGRYWARQDRKNKFKSKPVQLCKVCIEPIQRVSWGTCGKVECKKELRRRRSVRHLLKVRLKVLEILGGAKCVYCGCDVYEALEINHKNGGGCAEAKTRTTYIVNDILLGKRNKEDFEVVCRVCNAWHYISKRIGLNNWVISWINGAEK
jgi:hypothetical protein